MFIQKDTAPWWSKDMARSWNSTEGILISTKYKRAMFTYVVTYFELPRERERGGGRQKGPSVAARNSVQNT